jgi:hypothetical protein
LSLPRDPQISQPWPWVLPRKLYSVLAHQLSLIFLVASLTPSTRVVGLCIAIEMLFSRVFICLVIQTDWNGNTNLWTSSRVVRKYRSNERTM